MRPYTRGPSGDGNRLLILCDGAGVILHSPLVGGEGWRLFDVIAEPSHAELLAAIDGARLGSSRGLFRIFLEGDTDTAYVGQVTYLPSWDGYVVYGFSLSLDQPNEEAAA